MSEEKKSPKLIQKNVEILLGQFRKSFSLPPSDSITGVTKQVLLKCIENNVWTIPLTLDSIFVHLVEYFKNRDGMQDEEIERSHKFVELFLIKHEREYFRFSDQYFEDRGKYITNYKGDPNSQTLNLEKEIFALFDLATQLANRVFKSKTIRAEHLILSFSSRKIGNLKEYFSIWQIDLEGHLYDWVISMDLSVDELKQWQAAFSFIEVEVNIKGVIRAKLEREEQEEEKKAKVKKKPEEEEEAEEEEEGNTQIDEAIYLGILGRAHSRGDQPTSKVEEDLLGRDHTVKALAEMIADEKQGTPFTIGLLGNWGAGKSTVMKMLEDVLKKREDKKRFLFADFNAWEYERTSNLEAGLAQEVVSSLVSNLDAKEKWRVRVEFAVREHGPKVLRSLIYAALILTGILIEIIWVVSNLKDAETIEVLLKTIFGGGLVFTSIKFWNHYKKFYEHPLSVELRTYLKLPSYGEHLGLIPVLKRHIKSLCQIRLGTPKERNEKHDQVFGRYSHFLYNCFF